MTNEAISVQVPLGVYLELAYQLRTSGDTRQAEEVVTLALKAWLGKRQDQSNGGYQWKELFLPDGTELRMRYRGVYYYAKIEGDQFKYAGRTRVAAQLGPDGHGHRVELLARYLDSARHQ